MYINDQLDFDPEFKSMAFALGISKERELALQTEVQFAQAALGDTLPGLQYLEFIRLNVSMTTNEWLLFMFNFGAMHMIAKLKYISISYPQLNSAFVVMVEMLRLKEQTLAQNNDQNNDDNMY